MVTKVSFFREKIIGRLKRKLDFLQKQIKTQDYRQTSHYVNDARQIEELQKELEIQHCYRTQETYEA